MSQHAGEIELHVAVGATAYRNRRLEQRNCITCPKWNQVTIHVDLSITQFHLR